MNLQAQLQQELHYDPETGIWTRLKNGRVAGWIQRGIRAPDYRYIYVLGQKCASGRLAWFYMTGRWPDGEIDHIDRNSMNDRWDNLRDVTREQNEANKAAYRNNKLGLKGVRFRKGAFMAAIRRNGVRKHLGCFSTAEEASAAYQRAAA